MPETAISELISSLSRDVLPPSSKPLYTPTSEDKNEHANANARITELDPSLDNQSEGESGEKIQLHPRL